MVTALFQSTPVPMSKPLHSPNVEPVKVLSSPALKSSPNRLSKFSDTQHFPAPLPHSFKNIEHDVTHQIVICLPISSHNSISNACLLLTSKPLRHLLMKKITHRRSVTPSFFGVPLIVQIKELKYETRSVIIYFFLLANMFHSTKIIVHLCHFT